MCILLVSEKVAQKVLKWRHLRRRQRGSQVCQREEVPTWKSSSARLRGGCAGGTEASNVSAATKSRGEGEPEGLRLE